MSFPPAERDVAARFPIAAPNATGTRSFWRAQIAIGAFLPDCRYNRSPDRRSSMDLSYAQHLEDYHLSLVFADQAAGFYIDVGAGHPVADNVSARG
jgi:hypothetical protein